MSNNAHDLTNRLLNALDSNYNVVDMQAVNEIICVLEKINITKELLETTRLGKHVNELRRRTSDAALARRAKVLVKRWRDLVIPTVASPKNNNAGSNRSSAERTVRRLGGTPLTSPALSRLVVSPAVPSPRPLSRPAWGGYESDSQDVILVDDEPSPAPLPAPAPALAPMSPVKRAPSPEPVHDDKKAKRDKKPKKRRGHSRAGSEAASAAGAGGVGGAGVAGAAGAWGARNGDAHKNGCKPLHALLPAGKKVKTTQELLEEIQSRASKPAASPEPNSPDVMLIEPEAAGASPLRNGSSATGAAGVGGATDGIAPAPAPSLLEDEELPACACGDAPLEGCLARRLPHAGDRALAALHHALLPGVNGTRAPPHRCPFAVRPARAPGPTALFTSVVPLYNYQDYADDYCVKNLSRVPLAAGDSALTVPVPVPVPVPDPRTCDVTDGRSLYELCSRALAAIPYNYSQALPAPVLPWPPDDGVEAALAAGGDAPRDDLGRPPRPDHFAEWHECARLGDLIALPYVVID